MPSVQSRVRQGIARVGEEIQERAWTVGRDPRDEARERRRWAILQGALGAAATIVARKATARAYGVLTGEPPPAERQENGAEDEPVTHEARETGTLEPVRPSLTPPRSRNGGETGEDVGLSDLPQRDYKAALKRAVKSALADNVTDVAAALAYYAFLAIPSLLLVAVGVFGLAADPSSVAPLLDRLGNLVPGEAITLLQDSLTRITESQSGGLAALVGIGFVLALWTITGAMTAVMRALNTAWGRPETRNVVRQRLVGLAMFGFLVASFALAFGLLVLGPHLSSWIGDALGLEDVFGWIWWLGQWPILIGGLLLGFAGVYYFGPNVEHPSWKWITPGALVATAIWLVGSAGFALYVAMFGSYNKVWGSFAAVVVMLTWLWLSGLALLLGAEINAELEREAEEKANPSRR